MIRQTLNVVQVGLLNSSTRNLSTSRNYALDLLEILPVTFCGCPLNSTTFMAISGSFEDEPEPYKDSEI